MKYRLIALDLDGTLLNDNKIITKNTEEALLKAQNSGIKVAIATGRMPLGVKKYAQQLQLKKYGGYCICFNGGLILDSNGEVVCKNYIDKKYLKEICGILSETDVTVVIHRQDGLFASNRTNKYTDIAPKTVNAPLTQVEDLYKFADWDFHKILLVGEPEKLKEIKSVLIDRFNSNLEIYFSAPWFLEVMPSGVNKGTGLKALCEKIGINMEEIIVCGDNYNDKPMLDVAGLKVVMLNGEDELKKNADYITKADCNNDGIAEVVKEFIL